MSTCLGWEHPKKSNQKGFWGEVVAMTRRHPRLWFCNISDTICGMCRLIWYIIISDCVRVADVCTLCLSYPGRQHAIAAVSNWLASTAVRCYLCVAVCDHRVFVSVEPRNSTDTGVCWISTSRGRTHSLTSTRRTCTVAGTEKHNGDYP